MNSTLLAIVPWKLTTTKSKHNNDDDQFNDKDKWTLATFQGPYECLPTVCKNDPTLRCVIVDDSRPYTLRLKRLLMKSVTCHQTSCRVEVITFHNLCQAEKYLHLFNCALVFLDNIFTNNKDRNGVLVTQGLITNKKIPTKLVLISGAELPPMSGNTENNISTMHKQAITEHAVRAFTMEAGIPVPRQKMKRLGLARRTITPTKKTITPTKKTLTKQSPKKKSPRIRALIDGHMVE